MREGGKKNYTTEETNARIVGPDTHAAITEGGNTRGLGKGNEKGRDDCHEHKKKEAMGKRLAAWVNPGTENGRQTDVLCIEHKHRHWVKYCLGDAQ